MKKRLLIAALAIGVFSFVYGENDYKNRTAADKTNTASEKVNKSLPAKAADIIKKDQ